MALECRICGNIEKNEIHRAREMMFGTRDEFEYLECDKCGTIQLLNIPDLSRYYPKNYYSYESNPGLNLTKDLKSLAKFFLAKGYLTYYRNLSKKSKRISFAVEKILYKTDFYSRILGFDCGAGSIFKGNIDVNSKILDYGCGNGKLLNVLNRFGFRNLTGADVFIESDISYPNGVKVFKRSLTEIKERFDLIMLHHSFEHLPNPLETLQEISRHLTQSGLCLIRIPIASFVWKKYKTNWVSLDPPRHLFLFTEKSFRLLAEKAGFIVEGVVYDSESFQFWGSEQYLMDIPLNDERSFIGNKNLFTKKQINEWKKQARELNAAGMGDQACFYLRLV